MSHTLGYDTMTALRHLRRAEAKLASVHARLTRRGGDVEQVWRAYSDTMMAADQCQGAYFALTISGYHPGPSAAGGEE